MRIMNKNHKRIHLYDRNGYIPDIIDNDGNIIPAEIFFSKKAIDYIKPIIQEELDKQLIEELKRFKKDTKGE
jgi:hypothetical protein